MEKFKLFDNDAVFVFNDKELYEAVMKKSLPEMKVTKKDVKIIENLDEFNSQVKPN